MEAGHKESPAERSAIWVDYSTLKSNGKYTFGQSVGCRANRVFWTRSEVV